MKKFGMGLSLLMIIVFLAACGSNNNENATKAGADKNIDKLSISFVPSRDPQEIITATEPLKEMLKKELTAQGYEIGTVDITVGTNYEAVGEALSAGTTDVGLIPGGTYVLYDDGAEVILTATRAGLNNDSDNPVDWNKNEPTEATDVQATSYRALLIAGPSEKGKALAAKVNAGTALTFEDLNDVSWNVMSSSSPAGYIYPALWLKENFSKTITDLSQVVQADSYASAFARLATGQTDVMVTYADARRDYAAKWISEYSRTASIWEETDLIGVMPAIYNDTISVSKNSSIMNEDLKAALQQAFINIGNSDAGKEVIAIYSHGGYQIAKDSDYDNERKAQELVQQLK
ncbi:MAG: PhnD/SsuA/transferrin family substrate-binding protein [Candidatus Pristimantibacillus lignocellulolyticus]|uniref:PhnD/SsuA/transferrin family substrate-binding protein n=1 Tax=Candidatus Pristimantibacillus lignocellulolyticus TaxID=2994561 RepID=A0A9J6ZF00_9BACL|nr:MAG: PhnD/SsuA/transferrin family substrate-binding protein [Candidatus Pristimantibacillus lignocellulolyticus]